MRYKVKTDIYGDVRVFDERFNSYLTIDEIVTKLNKLEEFDVGF